MQSILRNVSVMWRRKASCTDKEGYMPLLKATEIKLWILQKEGFRREFNL